MRQFPVTNYPKRQRVTAAEHSRTSLPSVDWSAFYVDEHNRVLPHSAFCGQTPGRDVLRNRGRGAGPVEVTRGCRAPDPRGNKLNPTGFIGGPDLERMGSIGTTKPVFP